MLSPYSVFIKKAITACILFGYGANAFSSDLPPHPDNSYKPSAGNITSNKKNFHFFAVTANAGKDTTLPFSQMGAVTKLTLNGSGSGAINSWKWTLITGGPVTIASPNSKSTVVSGFQPGFYVFQLTVSDGSTTASDQINVTVVDYQKKGESPCRVGAPVVWNLAPTGGGMLMHPYLKTEGFNILGGDTVKIPPNPQNGGVYSGISLGEFGGSAGCPVVVVPTGIVKVSGNNGFFRLAGGPPANTGFMSHVKVDGTYLRSKGIAYGFQCINALGLSINLATDLEVSGFYFENVANGIIAKIQSDSSQPWRLYNNFYMKNLNFHDMFIHRSTGEAMYLGHTSPDGTQAGNDGPTVRVDSIEVHHILIDSAGWDGIQVSSAIYASIHDNVIIRAGVSNISDQRAWILMGGNTTGKIFNNVGYNLKEGIRGFPYGTVEVSNNYGDSIFVGNGQNDAVYMTGVKTGPGSNTIESRPNFKPYIHDNIFNRFERCAILLPNNYGFNSPGEIANNLVVTTKPLSQVIASATADYIHNNQAFPSFPVKMVSVSDPTTGVRIRVTQGDSTAIFTDAASIITWLRCRLSGSCSPLKKKPTADAGPDTTINLPVSADTLHGSGTADGPMTYQWVKISGPATFSLANATSAVAILRNLVQGKYGFALSVFDSYGQSATDTIYVTVNSLVNQPPIANAGANVTINLPKTTVALDGSGSLDPNGTITQYNWTQVSGPATVAFTNASSATSGVTGLKYPGNYVFKLVVTDNAGATGADSITVTVNPSTVNQSPAANAGANQTITLPTNTVNVNGSASADPDGSISSYSWTKVNGPASYTIVNATSVSTTINGLVAGVYVFRLTVTDNAGATNSDSVVITVKAAFNQAPLANAGTSQSITLPVNSVTLNGSGSSDPDGSIASYSWSQVSGPTAATITGSGTVSSSAGNLVAGQYIFQLTVTDNLGATGSAQVKVTVAPAAGILPIANAGAGQTITLPQNSVTLDASASNAPGGSIVSYAWGKTSGPAQGSINSSSSATTLATGLVQGVYTFTVTITDNNGATATDQVTVTVNPAANQFPIANAGSSITITLPTNSATLNGSASSDPDGTIVSYNWVQVAGPAVSVLTNPNTATAGAGNLVTGQYTFELTVTDNQGASATAEIKINVIAASNQPPVANAGASKTIILPANTATLDGSNSADPDGSIVSYSWVQVSGSSSAVLTGANTVSPSAGNMVAGQYVFQLTVADNQGATSSAQVKVTVVAVVNQPPVANAGSGQTVTLPAGPVYLDGTNSFDVDGTIAGYSWIKISGGNVNISGGNTATPQLTGLQSGEYVFQLTVTDNLGATGTDQVTIEVTGTGTPGANPSELIANAGSDITVTIPVGIVTLNGTASTSTSGTISSYQWTQLTGANGAILQSPQTAMTQLSDLAAGEYIFQLTVTDDLGNTASATVKVTVIDNLRSTDAFILFPNPAVSIVNLRLINDSTGKMDVKIFDMLGKLVHAEEMYKDQNLFTKSIDISRLPHGMYTVQVIINEKRVVAKLIKQ